MMGIFGKKDGTPIDVSRQSLIWVHPEALTKFMTSSRWVITEGHLPEDVAFHHVYYDQQRQVFAMVLLSSTFKQLKVGEPLPELPPIKFKWWNEGDGAVE